MLLIEQYRIVCKYSKIEADTDCILSYFDYKLKEKGINPKPCPIYDDEGEAVAEDYPPDYHYLADYVNNVASQMEFEVLPEEAEKILLNRLRSILKNITQIKK